MLRAICNITGGQMLQTTPTFRVCIFSVLFLKARYGLEPEAVPSRRSCRTVGFRVRP